MSYCRHALRLQACSRRASAARSVLVSRPLSSTITTIPVTQTKPPARPRAAEPDPQGPGAIVKGGAASAGGTGNGEPDEAEVAAAMKRLSDNEGVFSKHGGKMVLGFLGGIGLWFLRNHLGSKAMDALKDKVEEACPIAPEEVEELRCANDYPPDTFLKVLDSARQAFPTGRATYPEFAHHVTSSGLLPEPLEMGFLLDRMALSAAAHPGIIGAAARGEVLPRGGSGDGGGYEGEGGGVAGGDGWTGVDGVELDLGFLMVAFSAAVNTTPAERIRQLWDLARGRSSRSGGDEDGEELIPTSRAIEIVGMLMASHQLPAGRYAVRDEGRVWPVQQYRLASGRDAFLKGLAALHEDAEKRSKGWIERKLAPTFDPAREEQVSYEMFERVLRSSPVSVWGEGLGGRPRDKL